MRFAWFNVQIWHLKKKKQYLHTLGLPTSASGDPCFQPEIHGLVEDWGGMWWSLLAGHVFQSMRYNMACIDTAVQVPNISNHITEQCNTQKVLTKAHVYRMISHFRYYNKIWNVATMRNIKAYLQLLIFLFLIRARLASTKTRSDPLLYHFPNLIPFCFSWPDLPFFQKIKQTKAMSEISANHQLIPSNTLPHLPHLLAAAVSNFTKKLRGSKWLPISDHGEKYGWTHQTIGLPSLKLTVRMWKYGRAPRRKGSSSNHLFSGASF